MSVRAFSILLLAISLLVVGKVAWGQGYFNKTVRKNPLTGRQEIVDLRHPRWAAGGQGGMMFHPATGSLQVTAVGRSRATGRLEYYSQYMNPWTGARYTTATRFNPYAGRYQTLHRFLPPPSPATPRGVQPEQDSLSETPVEADEPKEKPVRRIRVIEVKVPSNEPPPEESEKAREDMESSFPKHF